MLRAKSNFTNGIRLAGLACDTTVSNDPIDKTIIDDQQIKLDALALDSAITTDRLSEYMILYKDMKAKYFHAESKFNELERSKSLEQTKLLEELSGLRAARECYEIEAKGLRAEIELLKRLHQGKESISGEFKPAYRSPEEMMRARFDILGRLPIPSDMPLGVLRPVGIPERFTLHEFLLGSASGSLKSALTGYCAFTETTTMWCPEREEHGFYLTPLYKCDTGPRSNVIHRWVKVDIKARMPKPTGEDANEY